MICVRAARGRVTAPRGPGERLLPDDRRIERSPVRSHPSGFVSAVLPLSFPWRLAPLAAPGLEALSTPASQLRLLRPREAGPPLPWTLSSSLLLPGAGMLASVTEPDETGDLIRRFQQGNKGAFTEIFRRHRSDVARLVFRMMGPVPDAEDVIQEVFLQVHRSLGEFRGQSKFTTWLHRVTVNVVLMARRAARSRLVLAGEPLAEREADGRLLPDEDVVRRRRIDAFRRLLERLPEKKRTVYILHEIEGMAPAEIAEIVGAPVLTVRTRLFYARRELEEMMREEPALAQLAEELAPEGAAPSRERTEAT